MKSQPAKIHRPLAEAAVTCLVDVFWGGYFADKVIERAFKFNRQWGARDRHFIADSVYECVRWWRLLWWLQDGSPEAPLPPARRTALDGAPTRHPSADELLCIWRALGIQLLGVTNTAAVAHASPSEVSPESSEVSPGSSALPGWSEWKGLDLASLRAKLRSCENRAVLQSIPDWMDQRASEELGASVWQATLPALNLKAPVVLRTNRLKTDVMALQKKLATEGVEAHPAKPIGTYEFADALILSQRKNVFSTQSFQDGLFEVQDGASQLIAPLLGVAPGSRVIDACAGAGGKTLHLASLMRNKGKIIALDVEERKLLELRRRASRAGADTIETHVLDSTKTVKRLKGTADFLLLDVPCSGMGVLKRNPDSKWKLSPDEVARLTELQAEILENYSSMLKPAGCLVYATCSILPSENEQQIQKFLARHEEFSLEKELKLLPQVTGFDGFYAARLIRKK